MRRPVGSLFEVLFFLSGLTALACEVVLSKLLSYVFGSSHLATSTVLAAYMAGLSAGAWFFGRIAGRARPIVLYAGLELAIGLFYLLLPQVYGAFQTLALSLGASFAADPRSLAWVRFGLSFALVLMPTFMMGGTLPALVAAFRDVAPLDRSLSRLYAVNTLGAALGALVASYLAIPWLGLDGTMWACAFINAFVGVRAIVEHSRLGLPGALAAQPPAVDDETPRASGPALSPRLAAAIALGQGAISFSLQVVWFHLIGSVIGVTIYAFSLMLFAILLGIGVGSLLVPWLRKRTGASTYALFTAALFTMALGVAGSLFLWDRFNHIIDMLPRLRGSYGAFFARELVRLGYCLLLLGPTTLAMGVSLPALAASVRAGDEPEASRVGRVFAANTLGTIVGSIGTGFFLVGRLPSDTILRGAAILLLALGVAALWLGRRRGDLQGLHDAARKGLLATAATVVLLATLFPGFDIGRLTRGNHYYWWPSKLLDKSPVAAVREDAQSGYVTVTRGVDGIRTLRTNGKYEGTDKEGEFQDLFALIGGLYLKKYDRAALVGVGPARTLRTLYEMPFKHIDAVEYSPGIVDLARTEFAQFSQRPFADAERVNVVVDDGRNFLQLSRGNYDYVAVATSGAAFAGAGNIYSRDFFRAVRGKLAADGVFLLWVQIHDVDPNDVRSVLFTVKTVFPHVELYMERSNQQGFIVASGRELLIDQAVVRQLEQNRTIRGVMVEHGLGSVFELTRDSVLVSAEDVSRYLDDPALAEPELFTDMRPSFEYSTPYGLAVPFRPFDIRARGHGGLPRFAPPLDAETESYLLWMKELYQPVSRLQK